MDQDNRSRDDRGLENERRIDHLISLVERKTRTERHLEEHSDISDSPENIQHAKDINQQRENEIQNLKNIIAHGENASNNYLENTEKRFIFTEGYLNHNADHMDDEAFKNAKIKQEHRKEQMDFLK
ncbi:hypothetical protein I5677_00335 [Mobilitalea sibirica]|uniref:Uncharacterized protein n=1 Tax=Mobilitalea sibirica TaxID=1462919 RepID=A0A8J7KZ44_9FIRM|nr:hypothetical protein [Mobilitalea sibirica]MBH1939333.1 hypothetical protein [Mobilitalea sibirica]